MHKAIAAAAILLSLLALPVHSDACNGTAINSCTATCTSNCYLLNSLSCTNGQGVTLSNGADLDMCGKHITCTDTYLGACISKAAVTMTHSSSRVYSSVAPATATAGVNGVWLIDIDCAGKTGSRVDGLDFTTSNYGTVNCATVENNFFNGLGVGVSTNGIANSDSINDNHIIIGYGGAGIMTNGASEDIAIFHNLIELRYSDGLGGGTGIDISGATDASTVSGNVIIADNSAGTIIAVPYPLNFTLQVQDNVCDPEITDCAACRTAGYCKPAQAGFVFP